MAVLRILLSEDSGADEWSSGGSLWSTMSGGF